MAFMQRKLVPGNILRRLYPIDALHLFRLLGRGRLRSISKFVLCLLIAPTGFYLELALRSGVKFPYIRITEESIVTAAIGLLVITVIFGFAQAFAKNRNRPNDENIERAKQDSENQRLFANMKFYETICKEKGIEPQDCGHAIVAAVLSDPQKNDALQFKLAETREFFNRYVAPFALNYKKTLAYEPIIKVLHILEAYGQCSSIADNKLDPEYSSYENTGKLGYTTRIVLGQVKLIDHSLAVAAELFEKRKAESPDYLITVGKYVLAGLAHDLGKIETLREAGTYRKTNHPADSAHILESLMAKETPARKEILQAIQSHHNLSNVPFAQSLKAADKTVRALELHKRKDVYDKLFNVEQKLDKPESLPIPAPLEEPAATENLEPQAPTQELQPDESSSKSLPTTGYEWLDMNELLAKIAEKVNIVKNSKFDAIEHEGVVFVKPNLISELVAQIAVEKHLPEITEKLCDHEGRHELEMIVRTAIDEYVPEFIGKKYVGTKFSIVNQGGRPSRPQFCMPIMIAAFDAQSQKEFQLKRSQSIYLQRIHQVVLARTKEQE